MVGAAAAVTVANHRRGSAQKIVGYVPTAEAIEMLRGLRAEVMAPRRRARAKIAVQAKWPPSAIFVAKVIAGWWRLFGPQEGRAQRVRAPLYFGFLDL